MAKGNRGIGNSRRARMARAQVRLGDVQNALLDMARTKGIPSTLPGIAKALNDEYGLRREYTFIDDEQAEARDKKARHDFRSVERDLTALGINRKFIETARKSAWRMAGELSKRERSDIGPASLRRQFVEAFRHWHTLRQFEGLPIDNTKEAETFAHKFVHPRDWVPPLQRLPQHPFFAALSGWSAPVILTEAWLGAIDRD